MMAPLADRELDRDLIGRIPIDLIRDRGKDGDSTGEKTLPDLGAGQRGIRDREGKLPSRLGLKFFQKFPK